MRDINDVTPRKVERGFGLFFGAAFLISLLYTAAIIFALVAGALWLIHH